MALQHILGNFGRGQLPKPLCSWQASQAVYQYLVHILSLVTDNCSSWISGRGRMAVEIFSWPSLYERMCQTYKETVLKIESKKVSIVQELIQSDPTSCPQNQKGNN